MPTKDSDDPRALTETPPTATVAPRPSVTIPGTLSSDRVLRAHGPWRARGDLRRNQRYRCQGKVQFRIQGTESRSWAVVTDISRSGCYVELQATSPRNTRFDMAVEINGYQVEVNGIVRLSYPGLGMGVVFTGISDENRTKLDELLISLASYSSNANFGPSPIPVTGVNHEPIDLSKILNARRLLVAVAETFESYNILDRQGFLQLIDECENRGSK